jgi:alpha-L-rhamnosidase
VIDGFAAPGFQPVAESLPRHWLARWIEPVEAVDVPEVQRPTYQLAGEVVLAEAPVEAVLHATAHGVYEAFLNGTRVGDRELTPGFTAYRKRIQVQTYEVTDLLQQGLNALGLLVSDGWWRGQQMVTRRSDFYGATVAVLAELHVTLSSGAIVVFGTDGSWRGTTGHILAADLMAGEVHDLGRRAPGWTEPGTDRSSWQVVTVAEHPLGVLVPTLGPPTRRTEEIAAISVREVAPTRLVVDFGRNSNGWVRLTDLGPEGTQLTIEHGEALTPTADAIANEPHSHQELVLQRAVPVPFQTDVVVSSGPGSVFEPRHSTKGFRYVLIDGHPGPLDTSAITSVVVRSDLQQLGGFSCSDDDLNALHRAAEWSFLTNACDIPTDCPTRERAGWTGDWQLFVATAAYLYDVTDFSRKWLLDLAADQLETGAVTQIVPNPVDFSLARTQWWKATQGPAGWGDAAVHVPWELYKATGRTDVLAESFAAACRWVDYAAGAAASGRHPDRVAARPEPAAHEEFLWDSGYHFGDWNEPLPAGAEPPDLHAVDHGPTATAFLHRSACELSAIAAVLGDGAAAKRYGDLAARVLDAWQREFLVDGRVVPRSQPNLVRALAFGLVPDDHRAAAVADLVRLVREAGTHLGTGFLSTPFLLPVLADHGELDLAYELLLQRSRPSWLAMLDAGATTIWEGWDSMREDGAVTSSLNHFSMGAVISFLHRYSAGLQPSSPGYRNFTVEPRPGGGLTWARTHHDCPYGRIDVEWQVVGDRGTVTVDVPSGTTASLVLETVEQLPPGTHTRIWSLTGERG